MDAEHTQPVSALRPLRRTDKLIVREVGDELVAYALDTEQVTALDPAAAAVFTASDGSSSVAEIAARAGLDEQTVSSQLDRLQRGGLIASGWLNRRTLIGAAVAAPLLTIAAAEAAFAASFVSLAWGASKGSCSRTSTGPNVYSFTGNVTLTGASTTTTYRWELYEMSTSNSTTGGTLKATSTVSPTSTSYSFQVTANGFSNANHYLRVRVYQGSTTTFPYKETATPNALLDPGAGSNCSVS